MGLSSGTLLIVCQSGSRENRLQYLGRLQKDLAGYEVISSCLRGLFPKRLSRRRDWHRLEALVNLANYSCVTNRSGIQQFLHFCVSDRHCIQLESACAHQQTFSGSLGIMLIFSPRSETSVDKDDPNSLQLSLGCSITPWVFVLSEVLMDSRGDPRFGSAWQEILEHPDMFRQSPSLRGFRKVEAALSISRDCICMGAYLTYARLTSVLIPYSFNRAKLCFAIFCPSLPFFKWAGSLFFSLVQDGG